MMMTRQQVKAVVSAMLPDVAKEMVDCALVGSTYIHGSGNDIDLLVLVHKPEYQPSLVVLFQHPDWEFGGSTPKSGDQWCSWKQGRMNLLLTDDRAWFDSWLVAAEVCRLLALRGVLKPEDKDMRIILHDVIMRVPPGKRAQLLGPL